MLTIAEIGELSRESGRRYVEIAQFVKDWNRDPSRRLLMVLEAPEGGSVAHRTALAALVRCLCAREKVSVPRWVDHYGPLDEPFALSGEPLDGAMGEFVRNYTPSIAAGLGVFFDRELLDSR